MGLDARTIKLKVMTKFIIKHNDTIKAFAHSVQSNKLLASLYDDGFNTIEQIKQELIRKLPFFSGKQIKISITNIDRETFKDVIVKVNQ